MGWWKAPAPPLCSRLASSLTSGTIFMARKGPVAQGWGWGLGWPSPQLHSGPQQEELSFSGITMALATWPFRHIFPNTGSFRIAPSMGAPSQPVKAPQFTPVRHRVLCNPRQCQYSLRAEGTHIYTCTCMRTSTHTHTKCACVCSDTYTS